VWLISPPRFYDHRGEYINLWSIDRQFGIEVKWLEDDLSISKQRVIRGLHGDSSTYKLISCLFGQITAVVVCNDPKSKFYLKWDMFNLNEDNRHQLLIPPNHGLGHQVISKKALFWYKQSQLYRGAAEQFTLHPLDPKLGIPWGLKDPILSERDKNAPFLA